MSTIDAGGRIADRAVIQALGWRPGDPVTIRVAGGSIMVRTADDGDLAVSSAGRVHLPAAARHACAIFAGDRVLLAAEPTAGLLMVLSLASLDAMFTPTAMAGAA
ncbi:MAG TPA: AbrB/MazE/SpoVT family DNA-binding domain-containing protein [Micromonosporaceae bacterium]|jgi:bifunctional DNA-binding transcriptional regulator/antitoxin component of YhaV-PrlF toxin-antitoxin module